MTSEEQLIEVAFMLFAAWVNPNNPPVTGLMPHLGEALKEYDPERFDQTVKEALGNPARP